MSEPTIRALAICGPTSAGKSEIAVLVAEALCGEIVNADSRQVYRDLSVGTGWPSVALLRRVPHHLYGFVDPCIRYSAGEYVGNALAAIGDIVGRGRVPIVVGGTGLYIEALMGTMPLDRPVADDDVRERVRHEARVHPHEFLREWLDIVAPAAGRRLTRGDRYRTMRALEAALVTRSHEQGPSRARTSRSTVGRNNVRFRIAVLELERAVLDARIVDRVRWMFGAGLVDEAVAVARRCPEAPALTGLGYAEALAWQRGEATRDEAIASTVVRTLRYARRQQTWFRRMLYAISVHAADPRAASSSIANLAREMHQAK